ncbi:MAG: glycerol-3-phosphate 1-O-acyltransferase PlsY [Candidatus Bipolaricaulia bacterium]
MAAILHALLAYLIGAIPFSYLIAHARGVDVRSVGSGNVGATNVARAAGYGYGALALLLDLAKGVGAVAIGWGLGTPLWLGGLAVIGHNWSVFLSFQGGKGVATTLGLLGALAWPVALITLGVWGALVGATRYVSVGSVGCLLLAPMWLLVFGYPAAIVGVMALLGLLSAYRHRANIRRVLSGEEYGV